MKIFKRYMYLSGMLLTLPLLTGCAAGSATAAFALKAKEADSLTAKGERQVADRVRREIMLELHRGHLPYPRELPPIDDDEN